jgi:outer membrane protein assembly factor BamB
MSLASLRTLVLPLLTAALAGCSSLPSEAAPDKPAPKAMKGNWPIFRGNPLQTGVAASSLPERLEIRWKFTAKEAIEGTAAIVGDTVYVGSLDEHLYALKLTNGEIKWKYKGGPFRAPPSVHNGAVYIGDEDGLFHCVDAAKGKKLWTFETGSEISAGASFAGDTILVGSGDEHLYCLSKDGTQKWKFRVPGGPVMAAPAVVRNRTFVAGCDSTLHVINLKDGKELASLDIGGQTGASSALSGDHLYVGTMANQFLAINWKKPSIEWTFEAQKRQQPFFASAAVTDKLVLVGSRDKLVHALDRKNGREVWSFPTRGKVDSSPVVVGQRVFVGSLDGNLYVLDLAKGTELKKFELGRGITASPAVGGNCLVIGTQEGRVFCLGKK